MRRTGFRNYVIGRITVFVLMCMFAAGCDAKEKEEALGQAYQAVVEEHAKIFLPIDGDSAEYDGVILSVGRYLNQEADRESTLKEVDGAVKQFQKAEEHLEKYELPSEMPALLEECGIIPEEFEMFGNSRGSQLETYIQDLKSLREHLEHAEEFDFEYEEVKFWHDIYGKVQESNKGYYYYGSVNYWFAGWDAEQAAYVQEHVIDKLESCLPENRSWETEREIVEQKANRYLDDIEESLGVISEHLAEKKESLYEMKKKLLEE
ncbi:hypothetical protein AALA00_11250 [Lachnospiraceae bacterium 46-15]